MRRLAVTRKLLTCHRRASTSFLSKIFPFQIPFLKWESSLYVDQEPALDDLGYHSFVFCKAETLVYVAMSGGVDSSTVAALLKNKVHS